jgi:hypothetical protein
MDSLAPVWLEVEHPNIPGGGPGQPLNPERVQVAAQAWRDARSDGRGVQRSIAEQLNVSIAQASRLIRAAPEAGPHPAVQLTVAAFLSTWQGQAPVPVRLRGGRLGFVVAGAGVRVVGDAGRAV